MKNLAISYTEPLTEKQIKQILNRKYNPPQPPKLRQPRPKQDPAIGRRKHLKYVLKQRHPPGPKLDAYIRQLEERLVLLREIQDEA